jgi:hypothetical protein
MQALSREVRMATAGIDLIFEVQGASRAARSYAFLYAAFKRSEVTNSPVRDAIDCLMPFIISYLNKISGKQIDLPSLQNFLRDSFGFEIPLYAIEQLLPTLVNAGYAVYDRRTKIHTARGGSDEFTVAKEEIETDFASIALRLKNYAASFASEFAPPSGSGATLF